MGPGLLCPSRAFLDRRHYLYDCLRLHLWAHWPPYESVGPVTRLTARSSAANRKGRSLPRKGDCHECEGGPKGILGRHDWSCCGNHSGLQHSRRSPLPSFATSSRRQERRLGPGRSAAVRNILVHFAGLHTGLHTPGYTHWVASAFFPLVTRLTAQGWAAIP
jgi:hypothetical protein